MKVIVKLSGGYWVLMVLFCVCWGLGLIIHFFNNRVFPRILDDEGITTRNGKRYLWTDLVSWERQRLVLNSQSGPRLTGNRVYVTIADSKLRESLKNGREPYECQ